MNLSHNTAGHDCGVGVITPTIFLESMTFESTVHASSALLQSSLPATTVADWLTLLALVLFAGAYVGVCLLVAVWVRRDAGRTGRPRPILWASAIGVSLLSGGMVGLFLLAAYLWSRDSPRRQVAVE